MSLRPLDLTTALRPSLLPDETLLFVQNAVGLYVGKAKLAEYQNGQAYLTSHRACYVDNEKPRERAVGINLRDVERCEIYAGFLKSSPKVTLIPKSARLGATALKSGTSQVSVPTSRGQTPVTQSQPSRQPLNATWICPICSFSNPVPSNFDPNAANENTSLPACQACGIKPPLVHVIKAAVAGLSAQQRDGLGLDGSSHGAQEGPNPALTPANQCRRCTFENHPSLRNCEICGEPLSGSGSQTPATAHLERSNNASPAPSTTTALPTSDTTESIKFAFRDGGEKVFTERLNGALKQRKWLLQSAPPPPSNATAQAADTRSKEPRNVGIAGLERRGLELRKNNELVIGNAFEDLAALMASAKDIIALAEQFSTQAQGDGDQSPADPSQLLSQLNLTTTREHLSGSNSATSTNLYLTELSRGLAEYLTDDRRGLLKSEGGVMSLVDLWAVFNRTRSGVEYVSPADLAAAAELFDKLGMPIRLRRFRSGLLVVQERSRTDAATVASIAAWLAALRREPAPPGATWDHARFGRGVSVVDAAEHFGWSVGVAGEELEMAEEQGALCRESGLEGTRFWENWLVHDFADDEEQGQAGTATA